jgi:hypothetical protein
VGKLKAKISTRIVQQHPGPESMRLSVPQTPLPLPASGQR